MEFAEPRFFVHDLHEFAKRKYFDEFVNAVDLEDFDNSNVGQMPVDQVLN